MEVIKICPICKKEFVREVNSQVYCSACRKASKKKPKPKIMKKFSCNWCGKDFESYRKKKYCCSTCRAFANGRKYIRPSKQTKKLSLEEIAILSREAGLSYGQYVQKHNL